MAVDNDVRTTRRTLLAGAVGGAVAAVAAAVERPLPVHAGSDGDVVLGGFNNSASVTVIDGGLSVLGTTPAIHGATVEAEDWVGPTPVGVWGQSTFGNGVRGSSMDGLGVTGTSQTNIGVYGFAGITSPSAAPDPRVGVYGRAEWDDGKACGVSGYSSTGVGLRGASGSGFALRTTGRLKLERASGVATIRAGARSVTVAPGLDVSATTFVLLTARSNIGARHLWYSTSAAENTITIRMSSVSSRNARVGWLLLDR